jgi:hypothetical protein
MTELFNDDNPADAALLTRRKVAHARRTEALATVLWIIIAGLLAWLVCAAILANEAAARIAR